MRNKTNGWLCSSWTLLLISLTSLQTSCPAVSSTISPFVEQMYEQIKESIHEYGVVINRWPQYLMSLESVCTPTFLKSALMFLLQWIQLIFLYLYSGCRWCGKRNYEDTGEAIYGDSNASKRRHTKISGEAGSKINKKTIYSALCCANSGRYVQMFAAWCDLVHYWPANLIFWLFLTTVRSIHEHS